MRLLLTKLENVALIIIRIPLTDSGVPRPTSNSEHFQYRHVVFSSLVKSKIVKFLVKVEVLRINLNIDGVPVVSRPQF
jgi:hypothetical protein